MGLLDDELKRRKYCKVCRGGDRGPDMTLCKACGVLIVRDREKRRRFGQLAAECLIICDSLMDYFDEPTVQLRASDRKHRATMAEIIATRGPIEGYDPAGWRVDADGKRIYHPWDDDYVSPPGEEDPKTAEHIAAMKARLREKGL
jgi:hypothetical protein